jgi:hypothetical protein
MIVRFNGGNNAGHTIVVGDETFKLHLMPSGAIQPDKHVVIGNGVVVDPGVLLTEMRELESAGHPVSRLSVSDRSHLILSQGKVGSWHHHEGDRSHLPGQGSKVGREGRRPPRQGRAPTQIGHSPPDQGTGYQGSGRTICAVRHGNGVRRMPRLRGTVGSLHRGHHRPHQRGHRGGKERPVRGRPGSDAGHRPRCLPVRDLVQRGHGIRLRRRRRGAPGVRGGHRHREGLPQPRGGTRSGSTFRPWARSSGPPREGPGVVDGWTWPW